MFRKVILLAAIGLALLLAACNVWLGNLNLDEGWYLYAARSFSHHGQLPYRDFFFTQAPLMPVVYGSFSWLWEGAGVLGGRLFTAVLGLVAAAFAAGAAAAIVKKDHRFECGLTVFILLACNVYHSYFTVIPKTYALASLMLMSGYFCLALQRPGLSTRNFTLSVLGGFLISGAAASRLSLGVALAVTGFCCLLADFKRRRSDWLAYGIGGVLGLAVMIGIVASKDFEAFKFANFFHGARSGGGLVLAAGSVSRLLRNYMPAFLLLVASILFLIRNGKSDERRFDFPCAVLTISFAAVFVVQLLSPFPYDDYQVPVIPLACCAISVLFWRAIPASAAQSRHGDMAILSAILICAAAFAFSSPQNETWVVKGKDRFWVEKKEQSDIARLHHAAEIVKELSKGSKVLLTTDTYLAVEAGMDVPAGFEMGPFGFFPGLSDEEAERFHVVNAGTLASISEKAEAQVAAFSGYGLAIAAPAMTKIEDADREALFDIVRRHYSDWLNIPNFGQEFTTLKIWTRK